MRVLLNCAISRDGFLAGPDRQQVLLSDEEDLRRMHAMRAEADAIIVGVGTVLSDDPSLRVKPEFAEGADPLRVVLDTRLRTPEAAKVADGSAPTVIYHADGKAGQVGHGEAVKVGVEAGGVAISDVLKDLARRGVEFVMVEGGAQVLRSFLAGHHFEAWTCFVAPKDLGGGPSVPSMRQLQAMGVGLSSEMALGSGILRTFVVDR